MSTTTTNMNIPIHVSDTMKNLRHIFHLRDFVPPIFVVAIRKIGIALNFIPHKNDNSPQIQRFVSPVLGSYSQFNEDLLIDLLFTSKKKGFYLDIGANDPSFNSNTKHFYDKGWSGINIEPGKNSFKMLCLSRTNDVNLNIGVGPVRGMLTFYQVVGDSTLSSFDKNIAQKAAKKFGLTIEEINIDVLRLVDVFEQYIQNRQVDFMTVDAEGFEFEILQSNDWERFRPTIIMAEIDKNYHAIIDYMTCCNYMLVFNNNHNGIFIDKITSDIQYINRM